MAREITTAISISMIIRELEQEQCLVQLLVSQSFCCNYISVCSCICCLDSDPLNPADPLNILTRATVKKSSVLLLNEARKKSELEIKRKRLQDRMKGNA